MKTAFILDISSHMGKFEVKTGVFALIIHRTQLTSRYILTFVAPCETEVKVRGHGYT